MEKKEINGNSCLHLHASRVLAVRSPFCLDGNCTSVMLCTIPCHACPAAVVVFSAVFLANFDVPSITDEVVCTVVSAAPATTVAVLSATEAAVFIVDFNAASPFFNSLSMSGKYETFEIFEHKSVLTHIHSFKVRASGILS